MGKEKEVIHITLASILKGISLGNMTEEQCQPLCDLVSYMTDHRPQMTLECWEAIIKTAYFFLDQELNNQIPLHVQKKLAENLATVSHDTIHWANCEDVQWPKMLLAVHIACLRKWYQLSYVDSERVRILSQLHHVCLSPTTKNRVVHAVCSLCYPTENDVFYHCKIERQACPFFVPCKEYLKWALKRGLADIRCNDDQGRDALQSLIQQVRDLPVRVKDSLDGDDKQSIADVAEYLFRKAVSPSVNQSDMDDFLTMLI